MKIIKGLLRNVAFCLGSVVFGLMFLVALLARALNQGAKPGPRRRRWRAPDEDEIVTAVLLGAGLLLVVLLTSSLYFGYRASQPIKGWDKVEERSHKLVPMDGDKYLTLLVGGSRSDYIYYHVEGGQVEKTKRTDNVYVFEKDEIATESARIDWYQGAGNQWMKPKVEIFVPKGSTIKVGEEGEE